MDSYTFARTAARTSALDAVIASLKRFAPLNEGDVYKLHGACRVAEHYPAGVQLYADASSRRRIGLLLSGWACETALLPDGRRQIISILMSGDIIRRPAAAGSAARSIQALTPAVVADVSILSGPPNLATRCHLASALDACAGQREGWLFDQIVRLGRLSAYERVVHLLIELRNRAKRVGLVANNSFRLPLTQELLADVLGLSIVHVNRTVQQLKREGLIDMRGGSVTLLKPHILEAIGGYGDVEDDDRSWSGADAQEYALGA